jgi:hypothetical protein
LKPSFDKNIRASCLARCLEKSTRNCHSVVNEKYLQQI